MTDRTQSAREIEVTLNLHGGISRQLSLAEDSAELRQLFQALSSGQSQFFQLPVDAGREAFSFSSAQLVSVSTRPPVLVETDPAAMTTGAPIVTAHQRTRFLVLDDFLSPYEHSDMLAYAFQNQEAFEAGTVVGGDQHERQNRVILGFQDYAHSKLLCNRLLTWFPVLLQQLGLDLFPVSRVESQLTASNDGHYFRVHKDATDEASSERLLTCIYYFSRTPSQFSGGELRLYDTIEQDGLRQQADTYQQFEPHNNRLVVFPSDSFHELMPIRCPSHQFEDSRFAVTNWIWGAHETDPETTHGWGHLHCGVVPPAFSPAGGTER